MQSINPGGCPYVPGLLFGRLLVHTDLHLCKRLARPGVPVPLQVSTIAAGTGVAQGGVTDGHTMWTSHLTHTITRIAEERKVNIARSSAGDVHGWLDNVCSPTGRAPGWRTESRSWTRLPQSWPWLAVAVTQEATT